MEGRRKRKKKMMMTTSEAEATGGLPPLPPSPPFPSFPSAEFPPPEGSAGAQWRRPLVPQLLHSGAKPGQPGYLNQQPKGPGSVAQPPEGRHSSRRGSGRLSEGRRFWPRRSARLPSEGRWERSVSGEGGRPLCGAGEPPEGENVGAAGRSELGKGGPGLNGGGGWKGGKALAALWLLRSTLQLTPPALLLGTGASPRFLGPFSAGARSLGRLEGGKEGRRRRKKKRKKKKKKWRRRRKKKKRRSKRRSKRRRKEVEGRRRKEPVVENCCDTTTQIPSWNLLSLCGTFCPNSQPPWPCCDLSRAMAGGVQGLGGNLQPQGRCSKSPLPSSPSLDLLASLTSTERRVASLLASRRHPEEGGAVRDLPSCRPFWP